MSYRQVIGIFAALFLSIPITLACLGMMQNHRGFGFSLVFSLLPSLPAVIIICAVWASESGRRAREEGKRPAGQGEPTTSYFQAAWSTWSDTIDDVNDQSIAEFGAAQYKAGWQAARSAPSPAPSWAEAMAHVHPCGHTEAQHLYHDSGDFPLQPCKTVENSSSVVSGDETAETLASSPVVQPTRAGILAGAPSPAPRPDLSTFVLEMTEPGYYCTTFTVKEIVDAPECVSPKVGDKLGANEILALVYNGNRVIIVPPLPAAPVSAGPEEK